MRTCDLCEALEGTALACPCHCHAMERERDEYKAGWADAIKRFGESTGCLRQQLTQARDLLRAALVFSDARLIEGWEAAVRAVISEPTTESAPTPESGGEGER